MKKLLAILALAGAGWLTGAANAAVSLTKAASSASVAAGGTLTYTITLSNTGSGTALGSPDVSDTLPAGTVFLSVTPPQDYSCITPASGANGTVECFGVNVLPNTTQTFTLVVHVGAGVAPGTVLTNFAHLVASAGDETVIMNSNSVNVTVTVNIAAQLRSFAAVATARGVSLRWRLASQVGVLGFNVYRQVGATRTRVNRRLIAAHAASGYSLLDRRARRGTAARYWLQVVNLDGSRRSYGPARVRLSAG